MRTKSDKMARLLLPVIIGAGCMMAILSVMKTIAAVAHATPRIGDIVSFTASPNRPVEDNTRLTVRRLDEYGCVLDLNNLRQFGGSLVVETEIIESAGRFRVHWAGKRTSDDTGDCGEHADLILDKQELTTLASAAGGYGVDQKRLLGSGRDPQPQAAPSRRKP